MLLRKQHLSLKGEEINLKACGAAFFGLRLECSSPTIVTGYYGTLYLS
jgi:hypothetical protein